MTSSFFEWQQLSEGNENYEWLIRKIMISQYQANQLLKKEMPEIAAKKYPSRLSLEIYASMIYFTDVIKRALQTRDFGHAKKCFDLAETLYQNGDKIVRLLVEDSFIFSVSSVMKQCSNDIFILKSILPQNLYKVYAKHLLNPE